MVDTLSPAELRKNFRLFVGPVGWDQGRDRFANHFFSFIAVQFLCTRVPIGDNSVKIFCDDGIVGGLYDGSQAPQGFVYAQFFGDVARKATRMNEFSLFE